MARKKTRGNKMAAVRAILEAKPDARARESSELAKSVHRVSINPKMGSTYRHHVPKQQLGGEPKGARATASQEAKDKRGGIDELLHAAKVLGWQRVKGIVDAVVQAPSLEGIKRQLP